MEINLCLGSSSRDSAKKPPNLPNIGDARKCAMDLFLTAYRHRWGQIRREPRRGPCRKLSGWWRGRPAEFSSPASGGLLPSHKVWPARLRAPLSRAVSAARCAAAMVLVALAAVFATPAQAQTVETLVSNFGQSIPSGGNSAWRATKFTTGSNDDGDGFTISEVVMQLSSTSNFNSNRTYVTINNDDSGSIGTLVENLNTPASATVGNNTFSAPADTTLAENTSYWLVVNNGLVTNRLLSWRRTQGNGEDTDSATGWSIGNSGLLYNTTSTAWESSNWKLAIDIRGYGNGTSTCDALLCATMTVGTNALGYLGFNSNLYGALTPSREFTYNGATVQVDELYFDGDYDELSMYFLGSLAGSDYTLQLGELSFPLGDPGSGTFFEIESSDIDWTVGETVTVKLFEGLEGGPLSDDATLSEIEFAFSNINPDDPTDVSDLSDIHDFLMPPFHPDITYYTAVIPPALR